MVFKAFLTAILVGISTIAIAQDMLSTSRSRDVPLQKMFYHNPVHNVWIEQGTDDDAQPMLKVSFKEPVDADYIENNLYLEIPNEPGEHFPFTAVDSARKQPANDNDKEISREERWRRERMKQHVAKRIWWLKFAKPLPGGNLFALHVRNTSPGSNTGNISQKNVTLYQFKTLEKSSSGYLQKIFNPATWQSCEETKC